MSTFTSENQDKVKFNVEEILNPSTILWLLKIIVKFRHKKPLCLNASQALLNIVSCHQIVFDYQEDAIKKMFSTALKNLEYEESTDGEDNDNALNSSNYNINLDDLMLVEEVKESKSTKDIDYSKEVVGNESENQSESNKSMSEDHVDFPQPIVTRPTTPKKGKRPNKVHSSGHLETEKTPNAQKTDNKRNTLTSVQNSGHIGRVLGRTAKERAELTEEEQMEDQIAD